MATILIAASDADFTSLIAMMLRFQGYVVEEVCDAPAVVAAMADESFDLLLIDNVLLDLDGITEPLKAHKASQHMKVLMMTDNVATSQDAHHIKVLADGVIGKPFTPDALNSAVDRILTV